MRSIKRKIDKKLKRKTNKAIVETLIKLKKNPEFVNLAHLLSRPKRKKIIVNIHLINEKSKDGEIVVVPGKILGEGNLTKKITVYASAFSDSARDKINMAKGHAFFIGDLTENKIKKFNILTGDKKNGK